MFYIRDEGQPVREGFNFYPFSSKSSVGFMYVYSNYRYTRCYTFRYSKATKKLTASIH